MEQPHEIPPKHVKTKGVKLPWSIILTLLLYAHLFVCSFGFIKLHLHHLLRSKKLTPICWKLVFRRLLLKLATECTFKFNNIFFKQVDGGTVGGPLSVTYSDIRDEVFKNRPSNICGKQPLKNFKRYGLMKQTISLQIFLKADFQKFYFVHSWIRCPIYMIKMENYIVMSSYLYGRFADDIYSRRKIGGNVCSTG